MWRHRDDGYLLSCASVRCFVAVFDAVVPKAGYYISAHFRGAAPAIYYQNPYGAALRRECSPVSVRKRVEENYLMYTFFPPLM